jgi:hypothetical protein
VRLATQLDVDCWRFWIYDWEVRSGTYTVKVQAIDAKGDRHTENR